MRRANLTLENFCLLDGKPLNDLIVIYDLVPIVKIIKIIHSLTHRSPTSLNQSYTTAKRDLKSIQLSLQTQTWWPGGHDQNQGNQQVYIGGKFTFNVTPYMQSF